MNLLIAEKNNIPDKMTQVQIIATMTIGNRTIISVFHTITRHGVRIGLGIMDVCILHIGSLGTGILGIGAQRFQ
jgi:hypothetical protein